MTVGMDSKDFVYGFSSVSAILFCSLPFEVLVACFLLPIFEFLGYFRSWIVVGGSYNRFDQFSFQIILQDFNGAMIIKFNVGILD